MKDPFDVKLDPEEQEIEDTFNEGNMISIPKAKEEIVRVGGYVQEMMRKKKVVNLRLPEETVARYKVYAIQKNIPYQTLMASTLHEFSMKHLGK